MEISKNISEFLEYLKRFNIKNDAKVKYLKFIYLKISINSSINDRTIYFMNGIDKYGLNFSTNL